jgi:hypothetical protein
MIPKSAPMTDGRPRVLVVDDDESLLTLIAMRLDASGFETVPPRRRRRPTSTPTNRSAGWRWRAACASSSRCCR